MTPSARDKRIKLLALLEQFAEVYVHFDTRLPEVDVPLQFRGKSALAFRYGYNLYPVIPSLDIDNEGIAAHLSFAGLGHYTFIPWSAVFGIGPDPEHTFLYRDAFPAELTAASLGLTERPQLQEVAPDAVPDASEAREPPPPRVPFVPRLV